MKGKNRIFFIDYIWKIVHFCIDINSIEFEDYNVLGYIDVSDVISILNLFNIDKYPNKNACMHFGSRWSRGVESC